MKRKDLLNGMAGPFIQSEGNPGLRLLLLRLSSSPNSMKNSSSKIRRMWAGVREDCKS